MKQRSMNSIPTKGIKNNEFDSYEKIRQKYRSEVPSLFISPEKLIEQQPANSERVDLIQKSSHHEHSVNDISFNPPKRRWTTTKTNQDNVSSIQVNPQTLSQSVYVVQTQENQKQQKNDITVPPLTIQLRKSSGQSLLSNHKNKIQDSYDSYDSHDSHENKQFERSPKNQFLTVTREILTNLSLNQTSNPWESKTPNEILCSILFNHHKMNLFLKRNQQQSISEFHNDYNQWKNVSINIDLLACLLRKIQESEKNDRATIDIAFHNNEPKLKFSGNAKRQTTNAQKENNNQEVRLRKQLEKKNLLVQSVKAQYDKIISNYATTVMNLMQDKTNQTNIVRKLPKDSIIKQQQRETSENLKGLRLNRMDTFSISP